MKRLVEELAGYSVATGTTVTAVLDARPFELDPGPVDVHFAYPGRDAADDAIVEMIERHPDPSSLVVATSDKALVERVRALGADTISAGSLQRMLDERAR